ncbi:hypothetical protein H6758_02865 [Candidatus Nomurabacteria bacterium]|nr:hypothetical protein [Candidatus Nomurabacteria bacterium]
MKYFKKQFAQLVHDTKGTMVVVILVFGAVATMIIASGISSYAYFEHRASNRKYDSDLALHIAEAGLNYYKWHLAHNPTDYYDGNGGPSTSTDPYIHDYYDKDGNAIGKFELLIEEPEVGSTVVGVESTGYTNWSPHVKRTLYARYGFPSFADYTFLSNANLWFSFSAIVHGVIHSNGGIRFDGETDSWVKSAKETYKYENQTHKGVWGGGGPKSFWVYPVPPIDFDSVSSDLAAIRDEADASGVHLFSSGAEGYHVVFSGDTYDLYQVDTRDCYYGEGRWRHKWGGWYWDGEVYCFDIGDETLISEDNAIPASGMFFSEDNVWVEGTVDGRITIGVGRFPVQEPYLNIIINNNLVYNAKNDDDVVGLIAQGDIIVPYETPDTMEINAALLSQYGSNYRPYYDEDMKAELSIFGSQISYEGGGWKYVNGWGNVISGYEDTIHSYDGNLKYNPPPGFPVGNVHEILSWEEVE